MKLQPAGRQETIHIAAGCAVECAAMLAVFAALGRLDHTVALGAGLGWCLAVANFLLLGLSVQKAAGESESRAKAIMQTSYTMRNLMCALGVIVGFVAPCFHWVAVVLPLFFPRLIIAFMQLTGRYKPEKTTGASGDEGGEHEA